MSKLLNTKISDSVGERLENYIPYHRELADKRGEVSQPTKGHVVDFLLSCALKKQGF